MKILVLEPYFGGSHGAFLRGLEKYVPAHFTLLTLPARKWKWRMRLSAPYFAALMANLPRHDLLFCSTFVDVATLRGLAPSWVGEVPVCTYFHENQFAYPMQVDDQRDLHFGLTNLTTALASDRLAFNSSYNLGSFLAGVEQVMGLGLDFKLDDLAEQIGAKSVVLHPGIDFATLDSLPLTQEKGGAPVILWNHRWEHDKNPDRFFEALFVLAEREVDFRLAVAGQSFRAAPPIFAEARRRLARQIIHFGHLEDRVDYCRLLKSADLVVSTARHEFYGIAVIEAVRAGCRPLLPARLSYPELFNAEYLYEEENFVDCLVKSLERPRLKPAEAEALTMKFSWPYLAPQYAEWLHC